MIFGLDGDVISRRLKEYQKMVLHPTEMSWNMKLKGLIGVINRCNGNKVIVIPRQNAYQ